MKIVTDLKLLARANGSIWEDGEHMFKNEQHKTLYNLASCADMIESHLAYNDYSFMESRYSKKFIDELGYETVEALWNIMKEYFDRNCIVKRGVYTDCEGLTYNSIIDRQEM